MVVKACHQAVLAVVEMRLAHLMVQLVLRDKDLPAVVALVVANQPLVVEVAVRAELDKTVLNPDQTDMEQVALAV